MDGVLLVNKEENYTSQDVCNVLKKIFQTKKIGHCGTLDPFATGLLIVGINKGTKILQFLEKENKEYEATISFGSTTDTLDKTGKIVKTSNVIDYSQEDIINVLNTFLYQQEQIPPIYSAIKINGKKLYEYARNNQEVKIKSRTIFINEIELLKYNFTSLTFRVVCSKGTYIRTLAYDIAKKLNMEGHLMSLKRTKIGKMNVNDASTLDMIKKNKFYMYEIGEVLSLKKVVLNDQMSKDVINGKRIQINENVDKILLFDKNNNVLAIYEKIDINIYKCLRGLYYES